MAARAPLLPTRGTILNMFAAERNFDRNFIMFGKVNSGKSSLSNLLMGSRYQFEEHKYPEAFSKTRKVFIKEAEVDSAVVYGRDFSEKDKLKIQIMDQPGSNDPTFTEINYGKNFIDCIKQSRAELSDTFLLVVDITDEYFSLEEMISILNVAEVLSQSGYMFLQNAILVFTHIDEIKNRPEKERFKEKQDAEERFNEIKGIDKWSCIIDLLKLINERRIYINSVDSSPANREFLIKGLFELSKPILNVAITGNTAFPSSTFEQILKPETVLQKVGERFNVGCYFNPNLNIFRRFDKLKVNEEIENELKKLFIISQGISVMVVLISLQAAFSKEIYQIINRIPNTYSLQKSQEIDIEKDPLWKYTFIIFLSPVDDKVSVERNVKQNPLLKKIVERVNYRYTWVTKHMRSEECCKRLLDKVLQVNKESQGTSLINQEIVSKMNKTIKEGCRKRKPPPVNNNNECRLNEMQEDVLCFEGSGKVLIKANDFQWDNEISHILALCIIKNVRPEAVPQFSTMFPDLDYPTIHREKFREFCLMYLK